MNSGLTATWCREKQCPPHLPTPANTHLPREGFGGPMRAPLASEPLSPGFQQHVAVVLLPLSKETRGGRGTRTSHTRPARPAAPSSFRTRVPAASPPPAKRAAQDGARRQDGRLPGSVPGEGTGGASPAPGDTVLPFTTWPSPHGESICTVLSEPGEVAFPKAVSSVCTALVHRH